MAAKRHQEPPYSRLPDSTPHWEQKLSSGALVLFAASTDAGCEIVALHGKGGVWGCTLPMADCREYFVGFNGYVVGTVPRNDFFTILEKTCAMMASALAGILGQVVSREVREVIVVPDSLSISLPWTAPFIENAETRRAMRSGELTFGACAVPFPGRRNNPQRLQTVRLAWNSTEDLPLVAEELSIIEKFLNPQANMKADMGTGEDPLIGLEQVDLVHCAGHGFPLGRYSDPYFAKMADNRNALTLAEVQVVCAQGKHSLVVLNSCHAASSANRNHFQAFKSNENISFPSIFLLNRKSMVVAPVWAVPDLAAFAFSVFLYRRLSEGASSAQAYSFAVAEFFDATKADIISAIEQISDQGLRQRKVQLIQNDCSEHPFRRPYCYGAYRLHCLL